MLAWTAKRGVHATRESPVCRCKQFHDAADPADREVWLGSLRTAPAHGDPPDLHRLVGLLCLGAIASSGVHREGIPEWISPILRKDSRSVLRSRPQSDPSGCSAS